MPRKPENLESVNLSLELLKRIPRQRKISASELHSQLLEAGFVRDLRSIQRQLESLSKHFDIECDNSSRPYGYRWRSTAVGLSLPGLTEQESLLLCIAEQNLKNQLPASLMKSLEGFFDQARRNLSPALAEASVARAREWISKVRVVSPTLPMLPPRIERGVFEQVSQALYNNCWLDISYTNAEGKRTLAKVMPLGLAQQGVRLFMPCRFEGYSDTRNLALHRIQQATCTSQRFSRPNDFDLKTYDDNGRFAFGEGVKVQVHLWITARHAVLLAESPISEDQRIKPSKRKEGGHELRATVADSGLLVWWIRSLGKQVKVLAPKELDEAVRN
jgi:predicted DNA-binding transcriptional regulator YafY